MGTVVSFLIEPVNLAPDEVERALDAACAELHELDDRFSPWKIDSELSRLRRAELEETSSLMDEVFELCSHACQLSKGFFDPWKMPGGFDPTGLVKGWAAERALAQLMERGVSEALVNAGGDVCVTPGRTFNVGIRHPIAPDALCAVVATSSSVATSGVYERGDHLFNPMGGDVAAISATVVGGRLAISDALATALAVGGQDVLYLLERMPGVEGFFVTPEGTMFKTSHMEFSEVSDSSP